MVLVMLTPLEQIQPSRLGGYLLAAGAAFL